MCFFVMSHLSTCYTGIMNNSYTWYQTLIRPEWAPPSWLFGPVWSVLYLIIAYSFGSVLYKVFKGELPLIVALPFVLNIIFNAAFTPLQFGLKNNLYAAIDISLVLLTIIWMFIVIWPHMRWVVYANIPYFLWVSFATVLQFTITYLNR
jgi:tryptophan-rich sensory protein